MKAGFLQFNIIFGKPEENLAAIKRLTKDKDFDLLVIPELANSGYLFSDDSELEELSEQIPDGKFCRGLAEICADKKSYIVSGICERAGDKFYNSSVLITPEGEFHTYRKLHLYNEEKQWFAHGMEKPEVIEINTSAGKVKTGMMICFDWLFPETARGLAIEGAQIICHPSNLVMPYCQNAMFTRALENKIFTITANRTGMDVKPDNKLAFTGESIIVDPSGNYLYRASKDKDECIIVEIDPSIALNKNINPFNNLIADRREDIYT
jgi:predicted amidohydrolase